MHPILARQLKRLFGGPVEDIPTARLDQLSRFLESNQAPANLQTLADGLADFIARVDGAYLQFDRDLELRSRALKISSAELLAINDELRGTLAVRESAIGELQSLAAGLREKLPGSTESLDGGADSLTALIGLVRRLIERQDANQAELLELHTDLANQKFALDQHAIVSSADLAGNITYANDRFCAISGYSRDEIIGANHRLIRSEHHPDQFFANLWATIQAGQVWRGEIKNRKKNGGHYWVSSTIVPLTDANGNLCQYISIRTDITERKLAEEALVLAKEQAETANRALQVAIGELNRLAITDRLTGAWNRRHFEEEAAAEMTRVQRYGNHLSVVLFDIDHFKLINDRYGHLTGDQVLIEVTQRVARHLRAGDLLARWGGEEFLVMLPSCAAAEAMALAEKLRVLMAAEPFREVGVVTSSFGVAEFRSDETLDDWLKRVDDALYAAKAAGRNCVRLGP